MRKNDIIKIENRTFRILSIDGENVLVIDCEKKSMPQFFPASFFEKGEILENLPFNFPAWEDLSLTEHRKVQKRYTIIAPAVAVIADKKKRNMMI